MTLGDVASDAVLLRLTGTIRATTCSIEVILCAREPTRHLPPGQPGGERSRLTPARNNTQHPHAMSTFTCDSNRKPRTGPNGLSSGFSLPYHQHHEKQWGDRRGLNPRPPGPQPGVPPTELQPPSRTRTLAARPQEPIYHAHLLRVNTTRT